MNKLELILNEQFETLQSHLSVLDISSPYQLREFLKSMLEHKMVIDAVITMTDRMIEDKFTLDDVDIRHFLGEQDE